MGVPPSERQHTESWTVRSGIGDVGPAEEPLFSVEPLRRWIGFAGRSALSRHRLVAVGVALVAALLGGMLFLASPPDYQSTITIQLRGEQLGDAITPDAELAAIVRQAAPSVLRRDNLDALIDQLGLMDDTPQEPFFGRVRAKIKSLISSPLSADGRRTDLRAKLRAAILIVTPNGVDTLNVTVTWPDAEQSAAIANEVFSIFKAERLRAEASPKQRAVALLTTSVEDAQAEVQRVRANSGIKPSDQVPAGSELDYALRRAVDLQGQLTQAQIDLGKANESVEFRYILLDRAESTGTPLSSSTIPYVLVAFVVVALTLGATALLDIRRGRIVEPWQVTRLDVPLLGTVRLNPQDSTAASSGAATTAGGVAAGTV
jgi:uncharacterized protein involved in exopolysaccharide biosynthesis